MQPYILKYSEKGKITKLDTHQNVYSEAKANKLNKKWELSSRVRFGPRWDQSGTLNSVFSTFCLNVQKLIFKKCQNMSHLVPIWDPFNQGIHDQRNGTPPGLIYHNEITILLTDVNRTIFTFTHFNNSYFFTKP